MKKDMKRKKSNSSKSKYKTTTTRHQTSKYQNNRYQTKHIKPRVKKRSKLKSNVKFALLLVCIAAIIICKTALGTKKTILVAALLGFLLVLYFIIKILRTKNKRRAITTLLIFGLTASIACLGIFGAFLMYIKSIADPIYKEKEADLNTKETTTIYDKDGVEFAKLGSEMREKVTYDQLPEVLIDAIIATEDSRFFQHNGFDTPRFAKAALGQILGNKSAGGASTLSMQVVKNIFTDATEDDVDMAGITRKFTDIYLAVFKLEKNYTKEEIIEFYVNNHYLGGNIYGVEEASQYYFGKSVTDLNLSEAAIIAGMFKSPSYYRPDTHPENAEARRKTVLYLMHKHGYITEEEQALANSIPASSLVSKSEEPTNEYQDFLDTVVAEIRSKYKVNAYTTSLKVYTTLDRGRQIAVNKVLSGENYSWIDDKVQTGVAVLDSETGAILAVGAGRNRSGINSYNFATQIKRQPGSTAKPLFDYGPGMEYRDWSTYTLFDDTPYSYSNGRSIKNWDGGYYGTITLRRALSTSRNIPALRAFQANDNTNIRDFVTSLGIKPELCNSGYSYDKEQQLCVNDSNSKDTQAPLRLHEAHSIGAFSGVSPLEMSAAYAAFSNGGYYNEPYSVEKVIFRSTGETKEHVPDKQRVMSDSTAFMISSVLKDVALNGGTPYNVACKTGTTNYDDKTMEDYNMPYDAIRDSWVVGYSTKTVIGMWYGYDKLNQEMVDQGYVLHNVPATLQKDRLFLSLVNSGAMESNRSDFVVPDSVTRVAVAAGSNPPKLAGPGTSSVTYEYFKKGTEPTETDIGNARLAGPTNVSASYNDTTKKVTLTWNAVDPGVYGSERYGSFGYQIYLNDTLLGWTDKLSYTCEEDNPFGTYKIIATYKSYSGLQSDASTITVKNPKDEKETNKDKETTTDKDKDKDKETTTDKDKDKENETGNENESSSDKNETQNQ